MNTPTTIKQAAKLLAEQWDDSDVYPNDPLNHFYSGMHLRNEWKMWDKQSHLYEDAITNYKIAHGDDIYGLIVEWATAVLKGNDFDPHKYVERFEKHWAAFNMTPLQAGGYKE